MVRALSWVGVGHVTGQAFWFGSLLVLAAMLSPSAFGAVTIGLLMVTAATRLMEAGTRGTIIVTRDLTRHQATTALTLNVLAGLGLSLTIVLAAGPVARAFAGGADAGVIRVLGLSVALYAPAIVPLALLEKRFEFKRRATVQAASTMTASTLAVAGAALGAGVWALVVRQVVFQAMLAVLGWYAARRLLPPAARRPGPRWQPLRRRGAAGFLLFSLTDFVVFNADYLTVGHLTSTAQLGLYSLAFTIAFAPVTQMSAQLGSVLFPAAATSGPEMIRRRTVAGVRLTCLVLLPLIPVAIVLAPVLVPALLGDRWRGMVAPFQILIVVGVAHAIVNVIGESLSGTGHIGFRARVNAIWMAAMIPALIVLVHLDGIRGAALAHLALYAPVALAYATVGMRALGAGPRRLASGLGSVTIPVVLQVVVTATVVGTLFGSGAPTAVRAFLAAGLGLAAAASYLLVRGRTTVAEARSFVTAGRRGA